MFLHEELKLFCNKYVAIGKQQTFSLCTAAKMVGNPVVSAGETQKQSNSPDIHSPTSLTFK